ncbi:MAG: hypothetical protein GAK45_01626 [Pseudomonas citronellolis]|nr:MAG: hypothetical protein GAK45_01626 [Pseudomonas citronellolis]
MKTALRPDETLLKQGAANLQRGIETVGGHLYLTGQRLIFEAHALNVQSGASELSLADIQSTAPVWTKLFNVIPLAPNSLAVRLNDGQEQRFVLFGRSAWADAIDTARKHRAS